MSGYYNLFKSEKNSNWYFNLKAANHETILSSEGYTSKAGAEGGIASVQKNSPNESAYDKRESQAGYWFVLKAGNGEIIGKSEMYTATAGRDNGIESVKKNGPSKTIKE